MKPLELHSQNLKSITSAIQSAGGSVNVLLSQEVLRFLETLAENGVSLTAEFQSQPGMNVDADGWIVNTKTTNGHPATLKPGDRIEVEYQNGRRDFGDAEDWDASWDTNNKHHHITKYRKAEQ